MTFIPKYFDPASLKCKCGQCDGPTVTDEVLEALDSLVTLCGPLEFSCGVRCEAHNAAVGGAPDSRHLPEYRDAVDIVCRDSALRFTVFYHMVQNEYSWRFLEIAPNHIHGDMRPGALRLIMGAG